MKKITILLLITGLLIGCGVSKPTAQELKTKHPEWTNEQISLILAGKIDTGMTKEMVEIAWGKPDYINKMDGVYMGEVESWSYYTPFVTEIKVVTFTKGLVSQFSHGGVN